LATVPRSSTLPVKVCVSKTNFSEAPI
jgi:hypothetical protein